VTDRPRYAVELSANAQRESRRLPPGIAVRLRGPILALGIDPRLPGATRLAGADLWRLRVGDLRVVYRIDDGRRRVLITRVARRAESTYRRIR
jgi:mRNA interferase RelE/StbE